MTTKLVKWASNDGQIIKSGLSDGYGGKAITTAAHLDYDRHGFEGYPGNVGLDRIRAAMNLRCYAVSRGREWEALCLDLDIAVEADTFSEAKRGLEGAIDSYLATVTELPAKERKRMLKRKAPLKAWLAYYWAILQSWRRRDGDGYHLRSLVDG